MRTGRPKRRFDGSAGDSARCWVGRFAVLAALFCLTPWAAAQDGPEGEAVFGLTDMEREVFRQGQKRRELPCKISVSDPWLWFDFRLHATFEAVLSRRDVEQSGEWLRLAAQLTPVGDPEKAAAVVWNISRKRLQRDSDARLTAVNGMLMLGEGEYHLDWMIRDQPGRVCYERKKIKAKLSRGDREIQLRLAPGEFEFYRGAATWINNRSAGDGPLHLKVLLNIPPFSQPDRRLVASDIYMFISILDRIAVEPRVGRLDIVGFNLRDRKVLFRQDGAQAPDYEGLFRSMTGINNHEIPLESLKKGSSANFLTELINRELIDSEDAIDAAIFVGPRVPLRRNVSDEVLDDLDPSEFPVYYLRYRYTPWGGNWKDSISRVVSAGGGREYGVLSPKDLWKSVEKIIDEVFEDSPKRESAAQPGSPESLAPRAGRRLP